MSTQPPGDTPPSEEPTQPAPKHAGLSQSNADQSYYPDAYYDSGQDPYAGTGGYYYDPAYYAAPAPVPAAPAAPPPKGNFRRGFGLGAGAGLGAGLMFLILGSIGALISGLMLAAAASTTTAQSSGLKKVWGASGATKHLRSIEVTGPIMGSKSDGSALIQGTYGYEIASMIDDLDAKDADGLVLEMNTPGGTIYGARAIADAVKRYQSRTGKKVMAYVRGMSASGGMYAMAGANQIVADHGTLVGSIGVIMGPLSRYKGVTALQSSLFSQGVVTKGGITEEYLTQGKGKDFGNPFRDMTAEERTLFMKGLANEYDAFVNWVSTSRNIPVATIKNDIGAHIFDPKTAIAKKLIDAEMGQDEAYQEAAKLNGLDPGDTDVEREDNPSLLSSLLGASTIRGVAPAAQPAQGQPARVTSIVCTGRTMILAVAGDKTTMCG